MKVDTLKDTRKLYQKELRSPNEAENTTLRAIKTLIAVLPSFGMASAKLTAQAGDSAEVGEEELLKYAHPDQPLRYMMDIDLMGHRMGNDQHNVAQLIENFRRTPDDPFDAISIVTGADPQSLIAACAISNDEIKNAVIGLMKAKIQSVVEAETDAPFVL